MHSQKMRIVWGLVMVGLGALAWGGQLLSWLAPRRAVNWGLMEAQHDVEPAFYADVQAEARWDSFTLWTMVVAGALLVVDTDSWTHFGLVAGGTYLYFAGRGIVARMLMQRAGFRIGSRSSVRIGLIFLGLWGVVALVTIVAAVRS